jgi:hypothetical protein
MLRGRGEHRVWALGPWGVVRAAKVQRGMERVGSMVVDVATYRHRGRLLSEDGEEGMNVRVRLQGEPEGLDDGDHAGPGVGSSKAAAIIPRTVS